ncbi:MAG: glycosyltransferase [Thioploca sp.]|nr:glycosyltransferase [Thioploca sp.]
MKVSICTPVFNNWYLTESYLKDLGHLPDDHEIIIVNNGSTDKTFEKLHIGNSSWPKNLKVISLNENTGFAIGSNTAYKASSGEYILFLNNDIKVKKDHSNWTEILIERAKDGCLVGPTIGILDNNFNFKCEAKKMPREGLVYMSGWNLMARRDIWEKLIIDDGPFITVSKAYFEDVDLSFRAKELGIGFEIVDVPVMHIGKMTSKKVGLSELYLDAKKKFIEKWGAK